MRPIKHDEDFIELMVIAPITRTSRKFTKNEQGQDVLIEIERYVKDRFIPHTFEKSDIGVRHPAVNNREKLCKNRSIIFSKSTQQFFKVAHSYTEVNQVLMIEKPRLGIGFKRDKQ